MVWRFGKLQSNFTVACIETVLCLSPPQRLQLALITISIEIHFTTLYMADFGTRAEPLGEAAQAGILESLAT
jgi:hypothetical protein